MFSAATKTSLNAIRKWYAPGNTFGDNYQFGQFIEGHAWFQDNVST